MTQEVESNQRPSRPLVLPETFDGERDFDEWISHFEDVADLNGWNDGEKLRWLKVRLVGKAHVAFNRLRWRYTNKPTQMIKNGILLYEPC